MNLEKLLHFPRLFLGFVAEQLLAFQNKEAKLLKSSWFFFVFDFCFLCFLHSTDDGLA